MTLTSLWESPTQKRFCAIGAEIDPLQSEGKLLSDKLTAAGVQTDYQMFTGVTNKFFGMAAVVPQAKEAQVLAASKLKAAFGL